MSVFLLERFLARLPAARRAVLEKAMKTLVFEPGATMIHHEDETRDVYFLQNGMARVENYAASGRLIYHYQLSPDQFFGHYAVLADRPRSSGVVADTKCQVVKITGDAFTALVSEHPDNAREMMRALAALLHQNTQRLNLLDLPVGERVAAHLLMERKIQDARQINMPATAPWASWLKMTRESLSRSLSGLIAVGLVVKKGRGRYEIPNETALKNFWAE